MFKQTLAKTEWVQFQYEEIKYYYKSYSNMPKITIIALVLFYIEYLLELKIIQTLRLLLFVYLTVLCIELHFTFVVILVFLTNKFKFSKHNITSKFKMTQQAKQYELYQCKEVEGLRRGLQFWKFIHILHVSNLTLHNANTLKNK